MRNLTNIAQIETELQLPPELGIVKLTAYDDENNLLYIAGSDLYISCLDQQTLEILWSVDVRVLASTAAECDLPLDAAFTALIFSPDLCSITLGLTSGHLLLIPSSTTPPGTIDEVGVLEGGVVAAQWSPDGETLGILSGVGQLLLMTSTWDVLWETTVLNNNPAFPQPTATPGPLPPHGTVPRLTTATASLTWRGDGKFLATCSEDLPGIASSRVRVWDRETGELHSLGESAPGLLPRLSWQPNGRHLYVAQDKKKESGQEMGEEDLGPRGAQGQAPEVRHVGAWKRELRRREEAAKAAGQEFSNNSVILFERNGLQHGNFDVPDFDDNTKEEESIEVLLWSPNSELLAVVLAPTTENNKTIPHRRLQLWHRSNWHWYLKYSREFEHCSGLSLVWSSAMKLVAITEEALVSSISFTWECCTSALGTAAVIDGATILVTPLRESIVPPPLAAVGVLCPSPVVAVAIRQCDINKDEAIAAVLSSGCLAVVEVVEEDLWEETLEDQLEILPWDKPGAPKLIPKVFQLPSSLTAANDVSIRHIVWVTPNSVLISACSPVSGDILAEIKFSFSQKTMELVIPSFPAPGRILSCVPCATSAGGAVVQMESGQIFGYRPGTNDLISVSSVLHFPMPCSRFLAIPLPDDATTFESMGLNNKGELYWGAQMVASGVTSFTFRYFGPGGSFLLYTTRNHMLCTLPVQSVLTNKSKNTTTSMEYAIPEIKLLMQQHRKGAVKESDVTLRAIEEGSLLVTCPAADVNVLYQAPRGNLETARPRALVLPAVAAALDDGDFASAWRLAAVDRLDLNLLVDYKYPRFLEHALEFVQAVGKDVEVAEFLAGLKEGSVVDKNDGLYHAALATTLLNEDIKSDDNNKISAVCEAVRKAVHSLPPESSSSWLRTELTTYSKCGDLGSALKRIKEVKERELSTTIENGLNQKQVSAEQGLKHVLLYNLDEDVYRAALASYELEMAYMVVTHSQRDPGEYLLQLQQFAEIEDGNLRNHAINLHLKRFDKAVESLMAAGDDYFPTALKLAKENGLLRLLLQLTEGKPELKSRTYIAAGEELESRGKHDDAGLAFIAGGDLEKALRAYRLAGNWRQALGLAARLRRDQDQVLSMATRLASDLADTHRHAEAAAITLEYLNNVPDAVRLFAEANEWHECFRVAYSRGRADLIESSIAPSAALAASKTSESVAEDVERVKKYWSRLKELRQKRAAMAAAVIAADVEEGFGGREDDMMTEATSLISGLSIYTDNTFIGSRMSTASVTTVGGRRAKKKRGKSKSGKIRHGSPEEEAQLGRHVLSLAPLPSFCADTGQLTEALVVLGHADDAAKIQRGLKALIDTQKEAVDDLLAHPPPGLNLNLQDSVVEKAAEIGGVGAVRALEVIAGDIAGAELQKRAAEGEAGMKSSGWKWEVLRDP